MFLQEITRTDATLVAATPVTTAPGSGIVAGTRVETAQGWMPVESLTIGTRLHTLDGGLRPVRALGRHWINPAQSAPLICLPGGAFDNCDEMILLPHQHLLMDLAGDDHPDATQALIPAEALLGHNGCYRVTPRAAVEYICPLFDEEEVIWAASGVRLHCASLTGRDDFFACLSVAEARLAIVRHALDMFAA